jgi:hypothetical protein
VKLSQGNDTVEEVVLNLNGVSIAIMKCGVVGSSRESWGASSSYYLFPS